MFIKVDIQMRQKAIKELKGAPLAVYLTYALHMNSEGIAFPSLDTLVKETGYSRRNVQMARRQLADWGYLEPLKLSTRSTAYRVNHYVSMKREEQFERGAKNHAGRGEISNIQDVKNCTLSRTNKEEVEEDISTRSKSSYLVSSLGAKNDIDHVKNCTPEAKEIWEKVKEELQKEITRLNYKTWVKDTEGLGFLDGAIVVGAPSDFVAEWLEKRLHHLLVKKTSEVIGKETQVKVMVNKED